MKLGDNIYYANRINEIRKNVSRLIINQKSTNDIWKINITRKITKIYEILLTLEQFVLQCNLAIPVFTQLSRDVALLYLNGTLAFSQVPSGIVQSLGWL